MTLDLSNQVLKETNNRITTDGSEEVYQGMLELTRQAKRSLDIYTDHLDHRLYNSQDLFDAALKLATYSRHSLIRVIVRDSTSAVKQGNRLVQLSYRISSRIQIRKPPMENMHDTLEYFIADKYGLMYRPLSNRYEGSLNFNDSLNCRQLERSFNEIWEKSAADPELRQLML